MNHTLSNILIFAAGAAIGSAVSWKIAKTKYARLAEEEIASVKEVFSRRNTDNQKSDERTIERDQFGLTEEDRHNLASKIESLGYGRIDIQEDRRESESVEEEEDEVYIIEPGEFGEKDGYEAITLTYYADQVLTDENDDPVEDVEDTIGTESLDHFGEYEDDSVYVRNDRLKRDYEILSDVRRYKDVVRRSLPHNVED